MTLESFIYESIADVIKGDFENTKPLIIKHKEIYNNDSAICFILLALGSFVEKKYDEYYQFMNDAQFLVEQTNFRLCKFY